jgi:hypothetical protein
MQAMVGQEVPFDQGRQQRKVLADLEVTTKAVERTAEAMGQDIAAREQAEIQRAMQLDLPMIVGEPIPVLYVQMDGTGIPVVKKETEGRQGKTEGQPAHTREVKLGCVFTQTIWDEEGYALRDPHSTTYVGAIETARGVWQTPLRGGLEPGLEPRRKESRDGGWIGMDLESGPRALSRRDPDRGSVPRARTSLGTGSQTASE